MEDTRKILTSTPPMGWMSWNLLAKNISDSAVREMAQAMVSTGMRDLGYQYICMDDHWHGGRDEHGALYPNAEKFPHGIAALADYVHSLGLKLGIYSDAGSKTCGGCPGSGGYEEIDARTFASWGIDYLKYDFCYATDTRADAFALYSRMGQALKNSGRDIVFGICEWGHHRPWLWGNQAGGHLWRTTTDIWDGWKDGPEGWQAGVETIAFDEQRGLESFAGPDHWNDPDMLVVGLKGKGAVVGPGCTDTEYRTQMSAWCMLAAPLMTSCDLRHMDAVTRETLTNPEVIAINQDALGKQGYRVCRSSRAEVWKKPFVNGDWAVALFNREEEPRTVKAHWSDLEIEGRYAIRDLWSRADMGECDESYAFEVDAHGSVLLRLSRA